MTSTSTTSTETGVLVRDVAYARAGDKGNTSNVVVIVYDEGNYDWLLENLTVEAVAAVFGKVGNHPVASLRKLLGVIDQHTDQFGHIDRRDGEAVAVIFQPR